VVIYQKPNLIYILGKHNYNPISNKFIHIVTFRHFVNFIHIIGFFAQFHPHRWAFFSNSFTSLISFISLFHHHRCCQLHDTIILFLEFHFLIHVVYFMGVDLYFKCMLYGYFLASIFIHVLVLFLWSISS